ncbi:hypothetical protein B7P43_G05559 [Cryptotermes secundus]|uniref:Uncharacterized protein n=1 Tax=Cryptotermes secundus TaxID=105785 RepID=A0A2J7QU18_9NEOP|nr:hypothetical protein B7P43_G05559 [Cryptotermes secundus]
MPHGESRWSKKGNSMKLDEVRILQADFRTESGAQQERRKKRKAARGQDDEEEQKEADYGAGEQ